MTYKQLKVIYIEPQVTCSEHNVNNSDHKVT